ncbi:MAG: hydrogenase maturation protease [Candidatus Alcyoniella australis]|nr:hydrogenase maturation protease [Candidatus Alcyoniella australis]
MIDSKTRVLLIGYGNPGRLDDGLGPALIERLTGLDLPEVTVDSNYQLSVEDAAAVAEHDVVIFVDAAVKGPEPFFFCRIQPKAATSFSSHSVEPAAVLALAHELFQSKARGYALGIRGHEFNEFGQWLGERATANLEAALEFIVPLLLSKDFETALTDDLSFADLN